MDKSYSEHVLCTYLTPNPTNRALYLEAGQRTDDHLTDPSTDQRNPTKNSTASDRKIVQQADSVPCLGKKFSMMPSDRIENSAL